MLFNRSNILFITLILIASFCISGHILAVEIQDKTNVLVIGKVINIQSKILNEERPVWVYLPEDYKKFPEARYPVLYMLDGAYHFHHITGVVQVLAKRGCIPKMIVIAIPYIDYQHRSRDLSPTSVKGDPPVAAADNFLSFIKKEIIPFTEKSYRTTEYRILFGHSRAGLFSIYTLFKEPELFNTHICISPSLYWDDRLMFKKLEGFSLENTKPKRVLFLSVGGRDSDQIRIPVIDFAELLKQKTPNGLEFHYSFMENEDHGTIVHRAFYNDLETLYSKWRFPSRRTRR